MQKRGHALVYFMCALLAASCTTPDVVLDAENIALPNTGKRLIATTGAIRHTIVSDKNSRTYICTEPAPDAAVSADLNFDFGISLIRLGDSESADENQDVDMEGLGGRSANVLIVRDLLYRTCELFINSKFSEQQKLELFRDVLKTVERVGVAKIAPGTPPGERKPVIFPRVPGAKAANGGDNSGGQQCSSNPEASDCTDYCSKNKDAAICNAVCSASGNDSETYSWCSSK